MWDCFHACSRAHADGGADWGGTSPSSGVVVPERTPVAGLARPTALHGSPGDYVGRTACKELIEAAQKAPRPTAEPHPSSNTEFAVVWSELSENFNWGPNAINSCKSVFKHIDVSLRDVLIHFGHVYNVFNSYKKLSVQGTKAANALNELLVEEESWTYGSKRMKAMSGEGFRKWVEKVVTDRVPGEDKETGADDAEGVATPGGVFEYTHRLSTQIKEYIKDQVWLTDPASKVATAAKSEMTGHLAAIVRKSQDKSTPSPVGSAANRMSTAQASSHSSVLAAEADKISAQARLEQAATKKRKVDGSLELRRDEEHARRAERQQRQEHDIEMERRQLDLAEKKQADDRADRVAQREHDAKMLEGWSNPPRGSGQSGRIRGQSARIGPDGRPRGLI